MYDFIKKNIYLIFLFIITLSVGVITFLTFIEKSFIELSNTNLQFLLITNIILLFLLFFFIYSEIRKTIKNDIDKVGINSNNKGLEGTSFKPLLETPRLKWKSAAFSKYGPARCLVTNQFNYAEFNNGQKMLFDLKKDPDENVNLANLPKQKDNVTRLGELLQAGWKKALPARPAK